MTWLVYIIRCSDGKLYTGITNNLKMRLEAHNNGTASKFTRARMPVTLEYSEAHPDRAGALKREAQIKRLSRSEKLNLISSG